MSVIRSVLIGLAMVPVGVSGYVRRHRVRYEGLVESGGFNLLLVIS